MAKDLEGKSASRFPSVSMEPRDRRLKAQDPSHWPSSCSMRLAFAYVAMPVELCRNREAIFACGSLRAR